MTDKETARIIAIGQTSAFVEWAIAALEHGEEGRALEYLAKAQRAMMPVNPGATLGGTEFYIPTMPLRSVA